MSSIRPEARSPWTRGLTSALAAVIVAACSSSDPAGMDPEPVPPIELPRALTAGEVEIIDRANAFGFHLAREVVADDDRPNLILSPLSASMALGMTLNGAEGATFDAMRDALALDGMSQDDINESYRSLIDLLVTLDPEVDVSLANAVWANEDVEFHQAFFEALRSSFDAAVESSDFADPATLEAINGWASTNTNGKIPTILDSLDPALVMLLLNAIWFDGNWTTQFDPDDTERAPFTRPDGSTVDVDLMRIADVEYGLGGGPDWSAVELPYGGRAWSMVVVMPHGDRSARDLFGQLDETLWAEVVNSLSPVTVDGLWLPKFTLTYDAFLNRPLERMGMEPAFVPGADFSRMSPIGQSLCIDFVRQKTFIEVDEVGTRAAAVTVVGIRPTSFLGIRVDRPFVFALRERLSGTILFVGLVEDPTADARPPEPLASRCR